MSIMNNRTINFFRRMTFWALDFFKGGEIKKNFKLLIKNEKTNFDDIRLLEYRKQKLSGLIKHAQQTVYFYKNVDSFDSCPIVDKATILNDYNFFISKKYSTMRLHTMSTSGSTGTPFTIFQDLHKRKTVQAEVLYYSYKLGYRVGNLLIYLRAINSSNKISKCKSYIQNQIQYNINDFSTVNLENAIHIISHSKNPFIIAYGSTWDELANQFSQKQFKNSIIGAITGADGVKNETIKKINKMFNIKLVNRYSNQENGILSQSEYDPFEFIINEINYFIEIYDDYGNLLGDGNVGRIIVTDLKNFAVPLIKFDTGDMAAIKVVEINNVKKRVLYNFQGRSRDTIYATDGKKISPGAISVLFWKFNNIKRFQFIQLSKTNYTVYLNTINTAEEKHIKTELLILLGKNANISIEYVSDFLLEETGKFKYIKCEYTMN